LATGLFATKSIQAYSGAFYGNPKQFGIQVIAVLSTIIYTGIVTAILFWVTDKLVGIKANSEQETVGLDETQHGEIAYTEAE